MLYALIMNANATVVPRVPRFKRGVSRARSEARNVTVSDNQPDDTAAYGRVCARHVAYIEEYIKFIAAPTAAAGVADRRRMDSAVVMGRSPPPARAHSAD